MRPRVVLNALALEPAGSGVQTYQRELLRVLPAARDDLAFSAVVQARSVGLLPPGVLARVRADCRGARRSLEGLRQVRDAALIHGLDVDLPLRPGAPTVATVHDLAVFDTPEAFGGRRAAGKRLTTARVLRRADLLIAVSAFTAERIRARCGRDAVVVHEAVPSDCGPAPAAEVVALRHRMGLPERFVLYVGNLEPRKDVPLLAAACRRIDVPLVLAGSHIATVAVPAGAQHVGHVSRADLPALYGAATVVAYVSRYEGFGLPPLEAMAAGAPVVATRTGALGDVAGDAACFVPIGDEEALAGALARLMADADARDALVAAGRRAVAALSWAETARATGALYRQLGV